MTGKVCGRKGTANERKQNISCVKDDGCSVMAWAFMAAQ